MRRTFFTSLLFAALDKALFTSAFTSSQIFHKHKDTFVPTSALSFLSSLPRFSKCNSIHSSSLERLTSPRTVGLMPYEPFFQRRNRILHMVLEPLLTEDQFKSSSMIIGFVEGWRQYVPLVVSFAVILDILLGSPAANLILAPMRRAADADNETDGVRAASGLSGGMSQIKDSSERVDSEALAQAALDKARNSMELRQYLEENKTDQDRMEEIRKKINAQMDEFDSKDLNF